MQALEGKYEVTVQSLTNRPEYWTAEFWQSLQRRLTEKGPIIPGRLTAGPPRRRWMPCGGWVADEKLR